ncbi:integrin beta pat-3-like [Sycon ciliatum]|uniref:integrin beta pat-3-like n=1 Tax=Sycon ciliatum TaxID=27933 RepID=UPI0031F6351F
MMQVAVCEQIGWREKSRKVMIVATDEKYHSAGDGRLAGIVYPNDGNCHLDENGYYTESLTQDYPSVGWLNERLVNHSILPIFTVTGRVINSYHVSE